MEVSVLASGSAGNAVYISDGQTSVLVDVGLSLRKLRERFEAIGRNPEELSAVLISHEHGDHIGGVGPLSRRYRTPVYCAPSVREEALERHGAIPEVRCFTRGTAFHVGTLEVQPFSVPHDARDPVCFLVSANSARVGIVTDVGTPTHLVRQKLRQCQVVVLEFNHDPDMLRRGSYPWRTKQRILSRVGHLSNEVAARLLTEILHPGLRQVVLAHLSEKNNHPELARMHAEEALEGHGAVALAVASQHEPTPIFEIPHQQPRPIGLFDPDG